MPQNANDRLMGDAIVGAAANGNEERFLEWALVKNLPENADSTYKANVQGAVETIARHYALGEEASHSISAHVKCLNDMDAVIRQGFLIGLSEGWPEESDC